MNQAVQSEALAPPETALTVVQRASLALGAAKHETELLALAKRSTSIVAITNADGYKECHAARMALKRERLNIESLGKTARDDATKFSKAVIAEERRLIALIQPEEDRLASIQSAHDEAIEEAERARVAGIHALIDEIKALPSTMVRATSAELAVTLGHARAFTPAESVFSEFTEAAVLANAGTVQQLQQLYDAAECREAEDRRRAAEQVRLDQQREEQAEAQRKLDEEIERKRKALAEEERQANERIAEARRVEDERQAQQRETLRMEQEKLDAAKREQEDADRNARLEQEQRERAEREEIEAKERAERQEAAAVADARELLETFYSTYGERPEFARIAKAIAAYLKKVNA